MDAQVPLLDQLFATGLLIPTGVDGLYGRSGVFEDIVDRLEALITRYGDNDGAEVFRFPPAIARPEFERSGYMRSFPQLVGTVHCFCGDERAHRGLLRCMDANEDWTAGQQASQVVLTPAACYPVYPALARRGALPTEGWVADVYSYCFRHEPSLEPTRMQFFRQREYVRIGTPDQVAQFRETWMERAQGIAAALELPFELDVANDPFFGRGGKLVGDNQRHQRLKFELLVPVNPDRPTACVSFNTHLDHFSQVWELRQAGGELAHTGCVGFGMERLTLALLKHHGLDPAYWPAPVRDALWPTD